MAADQKTKQRPRSSPVKALLFTLFSLFVFYVLSVGPIGMFVPEESHPALAKIYAPLFWLSKKASLSDQLNAYVEWWKPKSKPDLSAPGE